MSTIIDTLKESIRGKEVTVVFPESDDARIVPEFLTLINSPKTII